MQLAAWRLQLGWDMMGFIGILRAEQSRVKTWGVASMSVWTFGGLSALALLAPCREFTSGTDVQDTWAKKKLTVKNVVTHLRVSSILLTCMEEVQRILSMPAQFGMCRNLLRSWYGTLSGAPFWTPFHQAIQAIQAHHQGWELHCCWCSLCGGLTCGLPYSRIVDLCEQEGKTRTGQENVILKSSCEYVSYSYDHIFYLKKIKKDIIEIHYSWHVSATGVSWCFHPTWYGMH